MPSINSERVRVKRRASSASLRAYASAPTRVTCTAPEPATTKLPERTSAPGVLSTGSDSPVRSDSSISRPEVACTTPSAGTWSPVRNSSRSSRTICSVGMSTRWLSRITCAVGATTTASSSSFRFARISWKMPIAAFATSTTPNVASWISPKMRMTASITPRMALKRVKMFARRISP